MGLRLSNLVHRQQTPTAHTIDLFTTLRHTDTLKKLAALLILLVLLPAVFYSAYEISSLTQSETMVGQIYRQQLDAILFSVNQYAWDIANSWVNDINSMIRGRLHSTTPSSLSEFQEFINSNKGIEALFVTDTTGASVSLACFAPRDSLHPRFPDADFVTLIQSQKPLVSRLLHLQRTGYRKIEGVPITTGHRDPSTCLLFTVEGAKNQLVIAGIVLDAEAFIRDVLRGKLDEAGGNEFILSVSRKSDHRQLYATEQLTQGMERQTKDLWLFPDYILGIRMRGQTIEELVRDRFYRNLALLAILDLMIIAGVWFVYRTIRREMELARLKSDFVSNVSHELRTPLSLIRMFGETLEMGRVSSEEKKKEYYSTIVRESERLTGLVNNVLNFSRMESGKKEFHLAQLELNPIVQRVVDQYEPNMKHLGFSVQVELAAGLPLIRADEEAVSEALLNIVDNAMKYSAEIKSMRIATGATSSGIFVEVEDHGIGIAASEQPKIFDKFYRTSSGLAHHTKGSGLGLTLVHHIMNAHNGTVTVKSQVGSGSTFRLSFPTLS
jgi:two-component system phosphate regulon sensor histidine kinase PhoR